MQNSRQHSLYSALTTYKNNWDGKVEGEMDQWVRVFAAQR